ncbi:serine-repeat antigen [Plasmodium cynomolgi strain B]|uniref:Serine-repeat antigen n=2 Tax=Plasmodium cynomolgi TaxID=5827 RepID=K6V7F6_PLACD|nr:serine-repeat antigen [Plasmodium cynomolgi strain B]BAK08404.1 putative papain-like cysteine prorease [Plasmodium cynomolgi]GAB65022.1 serine-repeat antigen [Plasmodium cynomolgi strain B]
MRSCMSVLLLTYAVLNGGILLKAEENDNKETSPVSPSQEDTSSPTVTSPNPENPSAQETQDLSSNLTVQNGSLDAAAPGPPSAPQGATDPVVSVESASQGANADPQQPAPVADVSGVPPNPTETNSQASIAEAEKTAAENPPAATLTSSGAPETSSSNDSTIQVKTALLKDANGVKVTGPCGSHFELYLVPHISISAETKTNSIKLRPKLHKLIDSKEATAGKVKFDNAVQFEEDQKKLKNKCQPGKENEQTFKFLVLIHEGGELTLKWKVYDKSAPADASNEVDVRKYILKNLDQPITTIQVHSSKVNDERLLVESKSYYVKRDIPEKCDTIATACYLNGNVDIEKCFQCTLLMDNNDTTNECFKYVSSEVTDKFKEIKVNAQDEEDPTEVELATSIGKILQGVYKKGENDINELLTFDEADAALKEELLNYCASMKEVDSSGVLENYELGSEEEVFANLTNILKNHAGETKSTLQTKLKNPAICLKNADEWVESKKGLLLPSLSHTHVEATFPATTKAEHMNETNGGKENVPYDAVINLVSAEEKNNNSSLIEDSMYCTEEYCNRWKDDTSCVSKIEAEDQGVCATSWLFASKVHLETIKCMKGHDHVASSALYVANCSNKEAKDKCQVPSNPLEFLNILEETKFLPAESNLPYSYKAVNNVCPEPKSHWQNLWENVKLLDKQYQPNSVSTKGYTAYQSDHFKGNMDAFIKLVKSEVMSKGSVIAYVKADELMGYDFNGKKVHSLCSSETPNHAVNIIGYGNYITEEGQKKSYWLLRNSWGKYWGDDGNFKVDMHGPAHCQQNFIHTAAVFNLDIPLAQSAAKKDNQLYSYYLKGSPDLYQNLYYKGFGSQGGNAKEGEKGKVGSPVVSGQEQGEEEAGGSVQVEVKNQVEVPEVTVDVQADGGSVPPGEVSVQAGQGDVKDGVAQNGGPPGAGAVETLTEQPAGTVVPNNSPGGVQVPPSDPAVSMSGPGAAQSGPEVAQSGPEVTQSETVVTLAPPAESPALSTPPSNAAKITQVLHLLKHVKHGKVKTRLVTYDSDAAISAGHVCSRAVATDPEKQDECVKFCDDHWNECKDKILPSYCLTTKRGNNDCFFCYI